jgi:hypothetical protein
VIFSRIAAARFVWSDMECDLTNSINTINFSSTLGRYLTDWATGLLSSESLGIYLQGGLIGHLEPLFFSLDNLQSAKHSL